MNESDRSALERCLLASGLLSERAIDVARRELAHPRGTDATASTPPTDKRLADRLVETGQLNRWQASQLLEGRTKFNLGPYLIVDSIGQGGMGQVFQARHTVMGRVVAVKVLPLSKTTPVAAANFAREIRALASLDHPRLVRALDAGHDGNVDYLVCEYVPGVDLRKLVRRDGPLSAKAAADVIFQVAEGLEHAHRRGFVHRDVKPSNMLVAPNGEAKLSDLGLASPLQRSAESDPRFGKIVGTADYISPDHIKSPWNPTPAWDIYSLGCALYYAVTGKVPFPGGSSADKAKAHCELAPINPRKFNSQLCDDFVGVLADMMAKDPAERIQSAAEVMSRLAPWTARPLPVAAANVVPLPQRPADEPPPDSDVPPVPPSSERRAAPLAILRALLISMLIPLMLAVTAAFAWWLANW